MNRFPLTAGLLAASALTLVRLSPKKAPFRRGGIHFATLEPREFEIDDLLPSQLLALVQEPLVDVDESLDGGDHWRRYDLPRPDADDYRHPTDPAHSPERAIDPTGPIVPRASIVTEDGAAAPASAADPAVPIAPVDEPGLGVTGTAAAGVLNRHGRRGDRPVADVPAIDAQGEAARVEAERVAAEDAARIEAERVAAEDAARVEAERIKSLTPGKPPKRVPN